MEIGRGMVIGIGIVMVTGIADKNMDGDRDINGVCV